MMGRGLVGFRLNRRLDEVVSGLPGSSNTISKALFLLWLCQNAAETALAPQLLVADVRAVLRYVLPAQLRSELEAWLKAVGGTPPPALVGAVNRPMHAAVVREHAVRDDGAAVPSSVPGNAVRDAELVLNPLQAVLDEGEEF